MHSGGDSPFSNICEFDVMFKLTPVTNGLIPVPVVDQVKCAWFINIAIS